MKGYKYKCLICGNIDIIFEINLIKRQGCNVCCIPSHKVLKGYNDMWTTNPNLAKLLADPDDGYKYTEHNGHYVDWKCPNCGNFIKNKKIEDINKYGLSCPRCSDGISFGQKILFNVLNQLHIDVVTEKTFDWINKKRYDFYIPKYKIIIEVNGKQHYEKNDRGRSLKEEQENDKLKKELAITNGVKLENYIVIDCRKSELDWIKNNILKSRLNKLFDLSKIDWQRCHKYACNSLVKQACDLWNTYQYSTIKIGLMLHLSDTTIRHYLRQGTKLGLCIYDSKEVQKKNGQIIGECNKRKVICLNNKKIFSSICDAKRYFNNNADIVSCCKNKIISAGKMKNGDKLQWQYYEEYLIKPKTLLNNNEINKLKPKHGKKVICLNNNKIFNSLSAIYEKYKIFAGNICKCCKGQRNFAGIDPMTGQKLKWMYYNDYLKLLINK